MLCVWFTLRGLSRVSERRLLAGELWVDITLSDWGVGPIARWLVEEDEPFTLPPEQACPPRSGGVARGKNLKYLGVCGGMGLLPVGSFPPARRYFK